MFYVSIGFENFGNEILHKHLTKNEKDVYANWKPILEYVRNELGVYPHVRKIHNKRNELFNRQEKNFTRACNYIRKNMNLNGALLAHIHPDFIPAFDAEFYSVIDSNEKRYGNYFLNTINNDKFNNNIPNKNTFKFSRHNAVDDDENFVTNVATKIKESNGLSESIEEIEEAIFDKPTHYALYLLRNKVDKLVSVDFALNFFVKDRIRKQKKMSEYTGINLIDIDQGLPSRFNINWEQFRKEYECQAGQSFNN